MPDLSMNERQEAISIALRKRLGMADLYVAELYEDRAIYTTYGAGEQAGKSWEVTYSIDGDSVTVGEDATEVQRRTVYQAVKFTEGEDSLIEGLAIPFGAVKGKDIDGEDFGADTDLCLDWFPEGRPILYHHGLNGAIKTEVVGRQKTVSMVEEGAFVQAELDKRSRWYGRVKKLIDAGALGFSSGAMAHLVTATKSGHITRWPWVELSLTPTNAHPGAEVYAVKADLGSFTSDVGDGLETGPYTEHGERVLADVTGFLDRTDDRVAARSKAGRELSAANRTALSNLDGQLAEWGSDIAERRARIKGLLGTPTEDETAQLETELLVSELRRSGALD